MTQEFFTIWHRIKTILISVEGINSLKLAVFMGTAIGLLDLIAFSSLLPLSLYIIYPESVESIPYLSILKQYLPDDNATVLSLIIILGSAILLKNVINLYFTKKQLNIISVIATRLAKMMVTNYLQINYEEYSSKNSGEVTKSVSHTPISFAHSVFRPTQSIITELIISIFVSVFLFLASPFSFMASILFVGPLTLVIWIFIKKRATKINSDFRKVFTIVSKELFTVVDNYLLIKIRKKSDYFVDRFIKKYKHNNDLYTESEFYKSISAKAFEVFGVLFFISAVLLIHYQIVPADRAVLIMAVFTISLYRMIPISNRVLGHATIIKTNKHIIELIEQSFINEPLETTKHKKLSFDDKISMQEVSFGYKTNETNLLKGLDLVINKGDWIGIYGKSGSGKSTLLKVLLGIIEPNKGCVKIDSIDLMPSYLNSWFDQVGYLNQKSMIIDASLAENILFGAPNTNDNMDRIKFLVDRVGLGEWVSSQTEGLETLVGDRGTKISGGQAKRICLARLLFQDVKLLLLDEFTNETDPANNESILEYLSTINQQGTTIVQISHQQESLRYCNKVYEIEANGSLSLASKKLLL